MRVTEQEELASKKLDMPFPLQILHHWSLNFVNIIHLYLSDLRECLEGQRESIEG